MNHRPLRNAVTGTVVSVQPTGNISFSIYSNRDLNILSGTKSRILMNFNERGYNPNGGTFSMLEVYKRIGVFTSWRLEL